MGFGKVKALHAMDDKAHRRALERDIFICRADVEKMYWVGLAIIRKDFMRDDDDEHRSIAAPSLVPLDQQIEESLPLGCITAGVEESPFLLVVGRRRPTCGLEECIDLSLAERCTGHGPRRPAGNE